MEKFEKNKTYRLVDREGFIYKSSQPIEVQTEIADYIESIGNKFQVDADNHHPFVKILGGNAAEYSLKRELRQSEAPHFEEAIDEEVPLKQPNVPYSYNETEIKETIKVALEDDAFFAAFKLLSAADAAHVLSLKFKFGNHA